MPNKTIEQKIMEGRVYRNTQPFEVRQLENEDEQIVVGYATTFDEPYELFSFDDWNGYRVHYMEVVDSKAFEETDMSDTIMQYNHEGRVFARISNNTLKLNADEHGLNVEANLGGTEIGRQLYEEIKGGYTNRMSFGFTVTKDSESEEKDNENKIRTITRTILKVGKLYDVSAVSIPANDATEISSRSFENGVIDRLKAEHLAAEKRNRQIKKIKLLTEVF